MSTEYYYVTLCDCNCPNCVGGKAWRLGFSAGGWMFGWQRNEDLGVVDFATAKACYEGGEGGIIDESGDLYDWEEIEALDERLRSGKPMESGYEQRPVLEEERYCWLVDPYEVSPNETFDLVGDLRRAWI